MKLNDLFDNEHLRDGARSTAESLVLAHEIAKAPEHYGRNERDLAELVRVLLGEIPWTRLRPLIGNWTVTGHDSAAEALRDERPETD